MSPWPSDLATLLIVVQAIAGSVAGIVRDGDSGAPLPEATVALVDLGRWTRTDGGGRYFLIDVPAGSQHVVVRRLGYEPRTFDALVSRAGTLEIDVALRRAPIPLRSLVVNGAIPLRGLEGGEGTRFPDRGISLAAVREHPMLSEPDVFEALEGGEVAMQPESPSGFTIRGGASDQVAFLLDGIPILNPYHVAGTFSAWNPDALARVDLVSSSTALDLPDALSGALSGTIRAPGSRAQVQGSLSTTQSRLTCDGPLGAAGAGYLVSLRTAVPGLAPGKREASHVRGESGDWLGKFDTPLLGGRLGLLGYGSETEVDVAAAEPIAARSGGSGRNALSWRSGSFGGGWIRPLPHGRIQLRAWSVAGDVDAVWGGRDSLPSERMASVRREEGFVALGEHSGTKQTTRAGVRAQRSRTSYRAAAEGRLPFQLGARTPVAAAFAEHRRAIAVRTELGVSLVSAIAAGRMWLDPGASMRWKPSENLTLSCDYSRRHQYSQSLRNPESVVSNIFPADLSIGAGAQIPVARSDLGILSVDHRLAAAVRYGAQVYARSFNSLLLVAPRSDDPFATNGYATGDGRAYGAALRLTVQAGRFGGIADYGLQHVRLRYARSGYVPALGATHSLGAGVVIHPSSTSAVRLGITSLFGRRTTAVAGSFEWEACNLLDQGCEFSGSPYASGGLGAARLPAYCRVDLALRKSWRLGVAGRDIRMALFGTATNLLGRTNALSVAVDPSSGIPKWIEMRPRSPLVVGVDGAF